MIDLTNTFNQTNEVINMNIILLDFILLIHVLVNNICNYHINLFQKSIIDRI